MINLAANRDGNEWLKIVDMVARAGITGPVTCVYCGRKVTTLDKFIQYTHTFYPWSSQIFHSLSREETGILGGAVTSGILWFCNENIERPSTSSCFNLVMVFFAGFAADIQEHWARTEQDQPRGLTNAW